MQQSFKDKVVVITGCATGIGFSLAKHLGLEGAVLVIAGRRKGRLVEAVERLVALGIDASHCECDVRVCAEVEALADYAWQRHGQVDAIINNAGIPPNPRSVIDADLDEVRRLYEVNIFGVWHGIAVFGKRFIEQGTAAGIYAVGSENSLFDGAPFGSSYISSKHALLGIMDPLRKEVPEFIRVGLICPGFVKSEIIDDMSAAMDTDRYAKIVLKQMKAGEFYIVSHAHNMVHIEARYQEISRAYAKYAPRYSGDEEFDLRTVMAAAAKQIEQG